MKRKDMIKLIITTIFFISVAILTMLFIMKIFKDYQIKTAKKKVKFNDLEVEVYSDLKVKDLIKKINGKIVDNYKIDTTKLGEKEIKFEFINNDNIKVPYSFTINIVDKTAPLIDHLDSYTIYKGEKENIAKNIFCGDNYDDKPKCEIIGDYDRNVVGEYPVEFKATDKNNNTSSHKMKIIVKEKPKPVKNNKTYKYKFPDNVKEYKDIKEKYKDTLVGIDISKWQGKINFKKLKKEDVGFVILRVGYQREIEGEYILDERFKENIKELNKLKIPVGVYFYSKANSKEEAIKQAKWVRKKIKHYDVDLPVAFDWENFDDYQYYEQSFYHMTEIANAFMDKIEKYEYDSMLYGSKNKLNDVWLPTEHDKWLAHYTDKTDYEDYRIWQMTDNGKISGISNNTVDINIMK